MLFMLVGYSFYTVLYAFYRGTGRMAMANLWQLAVLVLGPIFVAWTYARTGQVHLILYLLGALLLSTTVPLGAELWNGARWQTCLTGALRAGKELLRYGLPRVPGGLLLAGLFSLGPLLAPYFGSAKEAGYLAVGQSIFYVSEAGLTAFGLVILPKVAQLVAEGRVGFLQERISDVLAFTIHFGLFTAIQFFVWSDVLVRVWLGDSYSEAIPLMRILLLGAVPYFVYVMLRSMIDGLEEKAVNTRNLSISAAVAAGFSLGLGIAGFGARGLAVGTALGLITLGLTTVRYLWAEGWMAPTRLYLTACLLLNAGALGAAGLFKIGISQLHIPMLTLFGLVVLLEGSLFVLYCFGLWRLGVRWLVQLQARIARGTL
jgi:O-antigen/teichoic acid export membrane protein